jgi:hypothetical protein
MKRSRWRKKTLAILTVLSFVLVSGCLEPIIWDIEPSSGRAGDTVVIVATAPNIPLYPGRIDFVGVPFDVTVANWIPVEVLPYFHAVAVDVPDGIESGCVTLTDNFLDSPSGCSFFEVLD